MKGTYPESGRVRPLALTMPEVALFSKPNGAPMASTHCPTCRLLELPRLTVGRLLADILITATSETLSTPMTLAVYSRRSVSWTVTRLAPATTCALVRIRPSGWMMKPEPSPRTGCSGGAWKGKPRKNGANGLLGPKGLPSPSSVDFSMTRMLTTAGPYFLTSVVKSGSITETPPRGWAEVTAAGAGEPCACAGIGAAPTVYRAASGAAPSTTPSTAATRGLRTAFLTVIAISRGICLDSGPRE